MRFIEADTAVIRGLTSTVTGEHCILRWQWPAEVGAVVIEVSRAHQGLDESASGPDLKLYTRGEYKANNGYQTRLEGFGSAIYTVYACLEDEGELLPIRQHGNENRIAISSGKAKIRYAIHYKNGWFRKFKSAQIEVRTEVPLAKDVLCYVKKQGGQPTSREDGTAYPFPIPFAAGETLLPDIEIGKDDYIRLFFTDGPLYGQLYELSPIR